MLKRRSAVGLVALLIVVVLIVGLALEASSSERGASKIGRLSSLTQTTEETAPGANVSSIASNGLRLSTSINATELSLGQSLNISVSVSNTRSTTDGFGNDGNWTFHGVPIATWPECGASSPYDWPYPIEVLIILGNATFYSVQELQSISNASLSAPCGGYSPSIPYYNFEPDSNIVNITAQFYGGAGIRTVGQFHLTSHFTVNGSWNLGTLSAKQEPVCLPAGVDSCSPPSSNPFHCGLYTVGVIDEWGQYNVLHVTVGCGG